MFYEVKHLAIVINSAKLRSNFTLALIIHLNIRQSVLQNELQVFARSARKWLSDCFGNVVIDVFTLKINFQKAYEIIVIFLDRCIIKAPS